MFDIAAVSSALTAHPITAPVSDEIPDGMSTAKTLFPLRFMLSIISAYSPSIFRDSPIPKRASMISVESEKSDRGDIFIPLSISSPRRNAASGEHLSLFPEKTTSTLIPRRASISAIAMPSPPLFPVPHTAVT